MVRNPAAELLKISKSTMSKKMSKYDIPLFGKGLRALSRGTDGNKKADGILHGTVRFHSSLTISTGLFDHNYPIISPMQKLLVSQRAAHLSNRAFCDIMQRQ